MKRALTQREREEGLEAVATYVRGLASEVATLELQAAKTIANRRGEVLAFTLRRQAQIIQERERHYGHA